MFHALITDDDPISQRYLAGVLKEEGFEASVASCLKEARAILKAKPTDVLLLDLVLPDGSGLDILRELETRLGTQVVVITGHASVETVTDALRLGASDYLTKPLEPERLKAIVANLYRTLDKNAEIDKLRGQLRELGQFGPLLGASEAMQRVYDLVTMVAPTEASVLLTGESGTGKELVAQSIHEFSRRAKGPFLPINCGAIAPTLMESELFGHEKGSFTGAEKVHKGFFERAHEGTLFLDEVTEMPMELQVKLLRVLETGSAMRIGGDEFVPVDVRVVAATNRPPEDAVAQGKFREDLFYRLNVFPIVVPPLRDRGDDVLHLAGAFLGRLNKETGSAKKLTSAAAQRLRAYSWPGNVRELKNAVQRSYILAKDEILPEHILGETQMEADKAGPNVILRVGTSLEEAEKRLIDQTLRFCVGDKKKTAEILKISLRTLYYRLEQKNDEREQASDLTG